MPLDSSLTTFSTGSQAIATFSAVELIDGVRTTEFNMTRVSVDNTAANDEYLLTTFTFVPQTGQTSMIPTTTELDFDRTFEAHYVVEGVAYFVIPMSVPATNKTASPVITIIHYDGTTETTMVAATTGQATLSAAVPVYQDQVIKITIPRTHFRKGDTLRITLGSIGDVTWFLPHDPLGGNTNFTESGGAAKAFIPFLVEQI